MLEAGDGRGVQTTKLNINNIVAAANRVRKLGGENCAVCRSDGVVTTLASGERYSLAVGGAASLPAQPHAPPET